MSAFFGNEVKWKGPKVRQKGTFAFIKTPQDFYYCREAFLNSFYRSKKRRRIFFSLGFVKDEKAAQQRIQSVAQFIFVIESKLKIKHKTLFNKTSLPAVVRLKIANFWLKDKIRLSLFTLLLRAAIGARGGIQYDPKTDNFEECLYGLPPLRATKPAVEKFLSGYTIYDSDKVTGYNGWHSIFSKWQNSEYKADLSKLIKPKKIITNEVA